MFKIKLINLKYMKQGCIFWNLIKIIFFFYYILQNYLFYIKKNLLVCSTQVMSLHCIKFEKSYGPLIEGVLNQNLFYWSSILNNSLFYSINYVWNKIDKRNDIQLMIRSYIKMGNFLVINLEYDFQLS